MAVVERLAKNLAETLSRSWWVLLLRGIVAILFGVLTFMQPGISLATLVLLFGAFAFADGVLGSWTALNRPRFRGQSEDSIHAATELASRSRRT